MRRASVSPSSSTTSLKGISETSSNGIGGFNRTRGSISPVTSNSVNSNAVGSSNGNTNFRTTSGRRKTIMIHEKQGMELLLSMLFANSVQYPLPQQPPPSGFNPTSHRFSVFKRGSFVVQVDSQKYDKQAFKDKEIEQYTELLLVKKLDHVLKEPNQLKVESEAVQDQLLGLIFKNFSDIVQGHESIQQSRVKIDKIEQTVKDMTEHLESFALIAQKVPITELSKARSQTNRLDKQFSNIAIFMGSPVLMDQLLKNGHYDETIDLILHFQKLYSRHPESAIIKKIMDYNNIVIQEIKNQLVAILRTQDKLPILLKTVGYLRRLDQFSEIDMRLMFLKERASFLMESRKQILEANLHNDQMPAELKSFIDGTREKLFDIVTQYKAAFGDTVKTRKQSSEPVLHLLPWFVQCWYMEFLSLLKSLKFTDMNCVHVVYTQLMYFGLSAGRLGFDFRHSMVNFIHDVVLNLSNSLLKIANEQIKQYILYGGGLFKKQSSVTVNAAFSVTNASPDTADQMFASFGNTTLISPPTHGSEYLVLCMIVNAYFTVFNQWRVLPLLSIVESQFQLVSVYLTNIVDFISEKLQQALSTTPTNNPITRNNNVDNSNDSQSYLQEKEPFVYILTEVILPHLLRAFQQGLYKEYFNKRSDSLEKMNEALKLICKSLQ